LWHPGIYQDQVNPAFIQGILDIVDAARLEQHDLSISYLLQTSAEQFAVSRIIVADQDFDQWLSCFLCR